MARQPTRQTGRNGWQVASPLVAALVFGGTLFSVCLALWWNQEYCEYVSSVASVASAVATVLAIAVAGYIYCKEHDRHSAGMLLDVYSRFYDSGEKRVLRVALEAGHDNSITRKTLKEAVRKAVKDEALTAVEEELLHQLDEYLNFFQFTGWLLNHKDLTANDVKGMFSYYVRDLCGDHNKWLLPYIHHYGFSGLERLLRSASEWSSDVKLLFVYGSLRKRVAEKTEQGLLKGSRRIGKASFWGKLYDVGSYPGLIESWDASSVVHGELYEVSPSQLRELDKHEACSVEDGEEYVRRVCQVKGPNRKWVHAYVYIYNKDTSGLRLIEGGDYVAYRISQR